MMIRMIRKMLYLVPVLLLALQGCGVYSFTGATIEGKSLNIHMLENRARAKGLSDVVDGNDGH